MSAPVDFTSLLARLLSDSVLRREFARDRERTAKKLSVNADIRKALASLDPECLNRQAETLLRKRWFEISQLLPVTCAELSARPEHWALFVEYAETFWPEGHRRHLEDTLAFGRFLSERGVKELNELEWHRFRFGHSGHLIQISRVRQHLTGGMQKSFWHCLLRNSRTSYREIRVGWL
jgi:hypothetical protein